MVMMVMIIRMVIRITLVASALLVSTGATAVVFLGSVQFVACCLTPLQLETRFGDKFT